MPRITYSQKGIEIEEVAASQLRSEGTSVTVGPEIELIASQINELSQPPPPGLKTPDFKHPIGDELEFPAPSPDLPFVMEQIVDESDFLPVFFLERGVQVQRSIARVVLTKPHTVSSGHTFPPGTGWATGFMVSPSLFLTNNHVIPDEDFARKVRMQFNFQLGEGGFEQPTEDFYPALDDAFHANEALDYTLIRLRPNQMAGSGASALAGNRWGFIPLNENPLFRPDQHFNIIQHPRGRRKEIALQDNELDKLFANVVRYKSDTEPGSSGSPVFDNLWQLVALHHAGGEQDLTSGKWLNNQGIRIDRIVEDLRKHLDEAVLEELGILI